MKKICKKIYAWTVNFLQTMVSLVSVLLFSSFKAACGINRIAKEKKKDSCVIMGNGPSLKGALEDIGDRIYQYDTVAVNLFCRSEQFFEIKPYYYVITDPGFFDKNKKEERVLKLQQDFIQGMSEVTWKMKLFIPSINKKSFLIDEVGNNNIEICYYNYTPLEGFLPFQNFLFKNNLGMPLPMTVVCAAIFLMINLGYQDIYLLGVDHSMIRNIYVNDNNELMLSDEHFDGKKDIKIRYSISKYVEGFADCMKSHERLAAYSRYKKINTWNATKGSYIDAYPRKRLS